MRMSRATTLLHLLLGLRTSASATATISTTPTTTLTQKSPATLFAQCHVTNLYPYNTLSKSSPLSRAYATMSSNPNPSNQNQPQSETANQGQPLEPQTQSKPLALPDSSTATGVPQLDVNGDGVKLDHLGPMVVNTDGTLARISNWAQMTEIERKNTVRVLGKRNKERLAKLKAKQAEEGGEKGEGKGE